uniref:RNA-dependent RNA polymerase n=1 Tax=Leptomonas pyrrhocoris qin-like virus TaxID=3070844 RepID=A0AA50Q8E6_9VIRU|nr:putative RNA-dependent RNA polymerase [Leptomonas pyrrhocoris qin-like virus]
MARVFLPPTYKGQDGALTLLNEEQFWREADFAWAYEAWHDADCSKPDLTAQGIAFAKRKPMCWARTHREILAQVKRLYGTRPILHDFDGRMYLWEKFSSGAYRLSPSKSLMKASVAAYDMSLYGIVGSFGSGPLAVNSLKGMDLYKRLEGWRRGASGIVDLADALRLSSVSPSALEHFAACISGSAIADINQLSLVGSSLGKTSGATDLIYAGPWVYIVFDDVICILGSSSRTQLADCIWTAAMWAVLPDMCGCGPDIGPECVDFVCECVRVGLMTGRSVEPIAKHMKTCYSAALCRLGRSGMSQEEKNLSVQQELALLEDAKDTLPWSRSFNDVLSRYNVELALNWGTAWNMLPAPDCDPKALNDAIKAKYNAPRNYDRKAWDSFCAYSASALTSHWVFEHRDTLDISQIRTNTGEILADYSWAQECLDGKLTYAEPSDRVWAVGFIPWSNTIETWHLSADDATHVYADMSMYSERDCVLDKELEYVMRNGSILSGKYSTQEVRSSWREGRAPGDRVLYGAAKSENTKFGEKVRETMSADDVLRAILSEVDENMSKIAKVADGVAMRSGRPGLEKMINKVASQSHSLLLSLDVSGWSPNMVREGEMQFIDTLMSMFDIPEKQRVSTVFTGINVVIRRLGFFDSWVAENGSIQGFFGTSDTILHTMLAQWALNNLKHEGVFAKGVKINKVALIDDIAISLTLSGKQDDLDIKWLLGRLKDTYLLLGFETDLTKTIASEHACNFLNRVYYKGREVLTYGKISAKADRQWESSWVSFHDEVDSIVSSFSGAIDRGMPSHIGYILICTRILHRADMVLNGSLDISAELLAWGAWLPRSAGGWGVPSLLSIVTKCSEDSFSSGLSVLSVIHRQMSSANMSLANALKEMLEGLADAPIVEKSQWGMLQCPTAVPLVEEKTPRSCVASRVWDALSRITMSPLIKSMIQCTQSETYRSNICSVFMSQPHPAELITEMMSSLPHAVMGAMVDKLIDGNMAARWIPRRKKMAMRMEFRRLNKLCINRYRKALDNTAKGSFVYTDSTTLCSYMRSRMADTIGLHVTGLDKPAVVDIMAQVPEEEQSLASVFTIGYDGNIHPKASVIRSTLSPAPVVFMTESTRESSHLSRAFRKAARITAVLERSGFECNHVRSLFEVSWFGERVALLWPSCQSAVGNLSRLAAVNAHKTFSSFMAPNIVSGISVSLSRLLRTYEDLPLSLPYMEIYHTLRSTMAIDLEMGVDHSMAFARHYSIRASAHVLRPEVPECVAPDVDIKVIPATVRLSDVASVLPLLGAPTPSPMEVQIEDFKEIVGTVSRELNARDRLRLAQPGAAMIAVSAAARPDDWERALSATVHGVADVPQRATGEVSASKRIAGWLSFVVEKSKRDGTLSDLLWDCSLVDDIAVMQFACEHLHEHRASIMAYEGMTSHERSIADAFTSGAINRFRVALRSIYCMLRDGDGCDRFATRAYYAKKSADYNVKYTEAAGKGATGDAMFWSVLKNAYLSLSQSPRVNLEVIYVIADTAPRSAWITYAHRQTNRRPASQDLLNFVTSSPSHIDSMTVVSNWIDKILQPVPPSLASPAIKAALVKATRQFLKYSIADWGRADVADAQLELERDAMEAAAAREEGDFNFAPVADDGLLDFSAFAGTNEAFEAMFGAGAAQTDEEYLAELLGREGGEDDSAADV